MNLRQTRNLLAIIWFVGFVPPCSILAARTLVGTYYHGNETEAWSWFTPNIVPTLGLIISTLKSSATTKDRGGKRMSWFLFCLTVGLSLIYVGFLNSIFLFEPLIDSPPLEIFKRSSLVLGVVQGLVTALLGLFFVRTTD